MVFLKGPNISDRGLKIPKQTTGKNPPTLPLLHTNFFWEDLSTANTRELAGQSRMSDEGNSFSSISSDLLLVKVLTQPRPC